MLAQVQKFIDEEALFHKGDRIILACSGGKDSMLLLDVLQKLNYHLVVAHCNFQLRGKESDEDECFVRQYCEKHQLRFRSASFETKRLSKENKIAIQEIARALRYEWLEEIRKEEDAHVIVTGHHLQDNIETLLFKLAKGTGVRGIRGILPKQGRIARPLLETSMEALVAYLDENRLEYREDSSNESLNYDRNSIRHQVLKPLHEINPNLSDTLSTHFKRWRDIEEFHELVLAEWRRKLLKFKRDSIFISIKQLAHYQFNASLLYELLRSYGFNSSVVADVLSDVTNPEVKTYLSERYRLLKDRKFLVLTPLAKIEEAEIYTINKNKTNFKVGDKFKLNFHHFPASKLNRMDKSAQVAYVDAAKLSYPLVLRKWKTGDYFYPIGLQKASGKRSKKNVAKLLRDEKVTAFDKENTWVLVSDERIVWVLAHRLDDRFKVFDSTKEVLKISLK